MLPWLGVPVSLAVFATSALADSVVTKNGERLEGKILAETALGVTIVDPAGLPHTFFHDELKAIHIDDASDEDVATGAVRSQAKQASEQEDADASAEAAREVALEHAHPFLNHEVTASVWGTSLGTFVPALFGTYRLLIGKYAAAYVGAGGGMSIVPHKNVLQFDTDGTPLLDASGNQASKSISTSFVDVPVGLELRYKGAFVGGGISYLLPQGVTSTGVKLTGGVMPEVELGYEYQLPSVTGYTYPTPGKNGHFSRLPHNLGFGFSTRYAVGPTPLYGGSLSAGWSF